jgi:hypothetical protein
MNKLLFTAKPHRSIQSYKKKELEFHFSGPSLPPQTAICQVIRGFKGYLRIETLKPTPN